MTTRSEITATSSKASSATLTRIQAKNQHIIMNQYAAVPTAKDNDGTPVVADWPAGSRTPAVAGGQRLSPRH
jgi:hypothetical protein